LTDVVMPGMSGSALADLARALRPGLRVLYASGYTDDALVRHGTTGLGDFIQKPFAPEALARRVREVLDRRLS
jgi:DNA-binding NtrC family response regulator